MSTTEPTSLSLSLCPDPLAWAQFLARHPRPALAQSWGYGEAMASYGADVSRYFIMGDKDTPLAAAQVLSRRIMGLVIIASCLRGPMMQGDDDIGQQAHALAPLKGRLHRPWRMRFLVQQPDWLAEQARDDFYTAACFRQVMTGYSTAWLNINRPPETLRASFKQKWRNALNAAERTTLSVELETGSDEIGWLLDQEERQRGAARYFGLPRGFVAAYEKATSPADILTLTARAKGQRVAAMMFLCHGKTATYHIGWSGDHGRRLGAHNLLLWEACLALGKRDIQWIDLGGLDSHNSPGIARFKLGTGALAETYCGSWL